MNLAAVATAAGFAFVLGRLVSRSEVVAARREASTDALTELTNRAGLMRELHNRTARRLPYTVLLFDLNGFKSVNDTHGHRTGDELLVVLAGRLRREFDGQVVARLGGDEFVLVLDGLYPAELIAMFIARVLQVVQRPARLAGLTEPVTISAAVGARTVCEGEDPRRALHAADQAMYRSKKLGRPHLQTVRSSKPLVESPRERVRDARRASVA